MVGRTNALIGALVSSVNGMTGAVILNANIAYDPSIEYDENTIGDTLKQGGGGGAVQSVNGMTGDVVLNANIAYNPETTYDEGTIGDALQDTVTREDLDDIRELPETSSEENGKVLAVVDGEWAAAEIPEGNLPPVTSADNGKVLGVVEGEWAVKDDEGGSLPDVTSADNGKVLGVVDGEWEKTAIPSGNLPPVTSADNGKVLGVVEGEWDVMEGGGGVVDPTLSHEGEAADAKAVGDIVDEITGRYIDVDQDDTEIYFRRKGYITDAGKMSQSNVVYYYYIPMLLGTPRTVYVEASETDNSYIAFCTGVASNNQNVPFAEGETGRRQIPLGTSGTYTIPENCTFFYVYVGYAGESAKPKTIRFIRDISDAVYENTIDQQPWEEVDREALPMAKFWWSGDTVNTSGYTRTIALNPGQRVRITNGKSTSCHYRLLSKTLKEIGSGHSLAEYASPIIYLGATNVTIQQDTFTMPEKYKYLCIFDHEVTVRFPTKLEFAPSISSIPDGDGADAVVAENDKRIQELGLTPLGEVDSNGWEKPTTLQQLNVIRKSNRYRFLQWTPLRDCCTRVGSTGRENGGISPAGTPFPTGVPYSSNWQDYKYIGITVSTHSFLTAVHNPYSLIYTEGLAHSRPKSAWGRKWVVGNGTCYFGLVCCGFTSAVTKSEIVWNNGSIPSIDEFYLIDFTDDVDPNTIKVGDIYNDSEHAIAIYALKRDSGKNVTEIKLSQSSSVYYGSNITTLPIAEFYRRYGSPRSGGGMYAYKYLNLYKNTDFVPEPTDIAEIDQILSDDSVVTYPTYPTYTNEICTFAGDKASFALGEVGHLIVINYNLDGNSMGSYDRVRLYLDGTTPTLVGEWTPAQANETLTDVWTPSTSFVTTNFPNPVDMTDHAVVVSTKSNPLAAGKYYAVLSDGTTDSTERTDFEVIDNDIAARIENTLTWEFTTQNKIVACYFGKLVENNGDPYFSGLLEHELTYDEELNKHIIIKKSDLSGVEPDELYVRLHTKGDYGTACITKKVFPSA